MAAYSPQNTAVHPWLLPYEERLDARTAEQIDLVVIHCTELPDLAMAREYGERVLYPERADGSGGTGNSGHYYIDRDGSVHIFVRPERIAHHTSNYNRHSIGIELVNTGRYPDWLDSHHQEMREPYPEAQILALIGLLTALHAEFPNLRWIAGHEDLDTAQVPASDDSQKEVARKRDPGPMFPWSRVLIAIPLLRLGVTAQR
jgi:N-acetylmuramoyl-L-alanine amidase